MIKPKKLERGDKVATISLSWGGAGAIPFRYAAGKKQLEEEFGLVVVETTHALKPPEFIAAHPELRAADLMEALKDPEIKGIISNIGGDDSIRMLPYLDLEVIRSNPKVFVGFSDTTVTHFAFFQAGVTSFYGPSLLAGFAENCGIFPYLAESFKRATFSAEPMGPVLPSTEWTVEHLEWRDPANATKDRRHRMQPSTGWNWLQGDKVVSGPLLGGCMEVLEFLKGTSLWPKDPSIWDGKILFLETSEDAPSPKMVKWWLRNYAAQGIFKRVNAVLYGRPGGAIDPKKFPDYDKVVLQVIRDEEHLSDLPIVTGMDFGHTEPFITLPIGVEAKLDCQNCSFAILEPAVTP